MSDPIKQTEEAKVSFKLNSGTNQDQMVIGERKKPKSAEIHAKVIFYW